MLKKNLLSGVDEVAFSLVSQIFQGTFPYLLQNVDGKITAQTGIFELKLIYICLSFHAELSIIVNKGRES